MPQQPVDVTIQMRITMPGGGGPARRSRWWSMRGGGTGVDGGGRALQGRRAGNVLRVLGPELGPLLRLALHCGLVTERRHLARAPGTQLDPTTLLWQATTPPERSPPPRAALRPPPRGVVNAVKISRVAVAPIPWRGNGL